MLFSEALFCELVALSMIGKVAMTLPTYGEVEIVDGKCRYRNSTVDDGQDLNLEEPCQTLKCEAKTSSFAILGCGLKANRPGCKLKRGTGVFPRCCYRPVCV